MEKTKQKQPKPRSPLFPNHADSAFSHSIQSQKDLAFLFITGISFTSTYWTNFPLLGPFATIN